MIRRKIISQSSVPVGTVPIYEVAKEVERRKGSFDKMNIDDIMDVLERAARDRDFIVRLTEEGSKALDEYTLSWEERAALVSGDLSWVEKRIGRLTDDQKTWFRCRLQQERW